MIQQRLILALEHLVGGSEAQVVLHEALQASADHLLLLFHGAWRGRECVALAFPDGCTRWDALFGFRGGARSEAW